MKNRTPFAAAVSIATLAASSGVADAAAFQLNQRSTKAVGASLAGSVSAASDVSFAGFNPAALSTVARREVALGVTPIVPMSEGDVQGTDEVAHPDQAAVAPSFAGGWRVADDVVLGLASHAPFGLTTDYESGFVAALDAETTELFTLQVSPMVAWEATERLTLGAAVDVLYTSARLSNAAIDFEGDAVDVGFSAGLLYEPVQGTRLGLAYHHGWDLALDGETKFSVLPDAPVFDSTAETHFPGTLQAGVTQTVSPRLRLMAEGRWHDWSDFDEVDILSPDAPDLSALGGPDLGDLTEFQNYEDTFFVGIGAEWDATGRLTLRGGVAFDETPTTDRGRTPRVPDEDRILLSAGASYDVSDRFTLDAGYSLLHMPEDPVVVPESVPVEIVYEDTRLHVISIGGVFRF